MTNNWLHEISWKDGRVPLEFHLQNIISKLEMKSIEEKEYRQRVEKGWAEQKEKAEDELLKNVDRDDLSKQKTKTSIFNSFEN